MVFRLIGLVDPGSVLSALKHEQDHVCHHYLTSFDCRLSYHFLPFLASNSKESTQFFFYLECLRFDVLGHT